jgi:hypothetical protein
MTPFCVGFASELVGELKFASARTDEIARKLGLAAGGAPATTSAGKVGRGIGRIARGGLVLGAMHKVLDPDVSVREAVTGGAALTGGGMLGSHVARKLKMGTLGGMGTSLLGSLLAQKAMRALNEKKRDKRARNELFEER